MAPELHTELHEPSMQAFSAWLESDDHAIGPSTDVSFADCRRYFVAVAPWTLDLPIPAPLRDALFSGRAWRTLLETPWA